MNNKKISALTRILKQNKLKLLGIIALIVLSSLLIIIAINTLTFPDFNSNKKTQNNEQNQQNKQDKPSSNKKVQEGMEKEKNSSEKSKDESQVEPQVPAPEQLPMETPQGPGTSIDAYGENGKKSVPNFNIDLSRDISPGNMPSVGNQSPKNSIVTGHKPEHYPVLEVQGNLRNPFLKVIVMESYSNSMWKISPNMQYVPYKKQSKQGEILTKPVIAKPIEPSKGYIPVISNMSYANFPVIEVLKFSQQEMFHTATEFGESYEMFYAEPVLTEEVLRNTSISSSGKNSIGIPQTIKNIANKAVGNEQSSYGKIKAVQEYLKKNYTLENSIEEQSVKEDALYRFLLISKKGSYLDFVSAYVMLLRSIDIQARVVSGYKLDTTLGYQVVYADQMYVYPEVKFDKFGWVPMDPFSKKNVFTPKVETETIINELDQVVKKCEKFNVKGTVKSKDGKVVDGLDVLIYIKKTKEEDCVSKYKGVVKNGTFEIECNLTADVNVGHYQIVAQTLENDIYRCSWSDPEMKVVSETVLSAYVPKSVVQGRKFSVLGTVDEVSPKKAVSDLKIEFTCDDNVVVTAKSEVTKTNNGGFKRLYQMDTNESNKPISRLFFASKFKSVYTITYPGDDLRLPASQTGNVYIWKIFWNRIITILILMLLGAIVVFFFLKKNELMPKFISSKSSPFEIEIEEQPINETKAALNKANLLSIRFPQIDLLLPDGRYTSITPDIWGINDPLEIEFIHKQGDSCKESINFSKKGIYRINVSGFEEKSVFCTRNVEIVSYREEIIKIGKELFRKIADRFVYNPARLTPRELIEELAPKCSEEHFEMLNIMCTIFEKATYSEKYINRNDYVAFYTLIVNIEMVFEKEKSKEGYLKNGSI